MARNSPANPIHPLAARGVSQGIRACPGSRRKESPNRRGGGASRCSRERESERAGRAAEAASAEPPAHAPKAQVSRANGSDGRRSLALREAERGGGIRRAVERASARADPTASDADEGEC